MNKTIRLFLCVLIVLLGVQIKAFAELNDGLVLYLPFDESPVAGAVRDESTLGNHGTVSGATYVPAGGKLAGAYQFDGVDDYIHIPRKTSLNVGAGDGFTLAAWYNTSADSEPYKQSPILEWSPGPQGTPGKAGVHLWANVYGYQWHPETNPNGGGTGANIVSTDGNEVDYVISTTDASLNQWHHLAVTYNRPYEVARVYIDGKLRQERRFNITPATDYDIYIGKRATDSQRLKGLVDEVRVYNRALTEFEVGSLYNATQSGKMYQDFEGAGPHGWTWGSGVTVSRTDEKPHSRTYSWKIVSTVQGGGTGIQSQTETWNFKAHPEHHDRLTFWVWAEPLNNEPNNVSVKFFDQGNYKTNGFEVWTAKKVKPRHWEEVTVLFTQLPDNFNLSEIDKIEFKNYWPGTYYIDDIQVASQDRVFQGFEPNRDYGSEQFDIRWLWNDTDTADFEIQNVKDGEQSWKLRFNDYWHGAGFRSQEQLLCLQGECSDLIDPSRPRQTFKHADLNPAHLLSLGYDRLTFWLYSRGDNQMDNNMGVQFFDWGNYKADEIADYDKQVLWTRKGGTDGQWTQLSIPLNFLPPDFLLTDINKIQFQSYWPGTYYLDGIKASKPVAVIDQAVLPQGKVVWSRSLEAARYVLEESAAGPNGPWQVVYSGTANSYLLTHLSESWLRVRWESASADNWAAAYISDWSDVAHFIPQPVLLKHASLQQGLIELRPIPHVEVYQIDQGSGKNGPWFNIYQGAPPASPLAAASGKWYRARAVVLNGSDQVVDSTAWGPALSYAPNTFVKANSTTLREQNGFGDALSLRGVNLGNAFLIEPWMLYGVSHPAAKKPVDSSYDPNIAVDDDVKFREILAQRFGPEAVGGLMADFKKDYLKADDFDRIMRLGMNTVRLPLYYRDIRELDADLNWVGSGFNFDHIDRIIEFSADRGLYVLLDLHGAPGSQSESENTGKLDLNKLFDDSETILCGAQTTTVGECYRRRTIELWLALAERYKNNTAVVGYDLLNEPLGAQSPEILWGLYDRIYDAIRSVDGNHMITMEGNWGDTTRWPAAAKDWDWLPDPAAYGWTNVVYQFHHYCYHCLEKQDPRYPDNPDKKVTTTVPEQISKQREFLDQKLEEGTVKQVEYDVPLIIGEFSGFGVRAVWEDYLNRFNRHNWSWMNWSYKTHDSPSEWGLYTQNIFRKDLPDIRNDSWQEIVRKMSMNDTADHFIPNVSLNAIMKDYLSQPVNYPPLLDPIGPKNVSEGSLLSFEINAADPNGQSVTYSASSLPSGAAFNTANRTFTWTPGFDQSGTHQVKFTVSDGVLSDQETVAITVNNSAVTVSGVASTPVYFSPNSDGRADTTTVSAAFNHSANWTLQIRNSSGTLVRSFSGSGTNMSQVWNGQNTSNNLVANGVYTATVTATDPGGSTASGSAQMTKDSKVPVVSGFGDSPDPFRPSTGQITTISYTLSEPATVSLKVYNSAGTLVRTLVSNVLQTTLGNQVVWNGRNDSNVIVPAGTYTYKLWVEDRALNRTATYPRSGTVRVQ